MKEEEQLSMKKLSVEKSAMKGDFTRAVKETEDWISKPHSEERRAKLTTLKELLNQRYQSLDVLNLKIQQSYDNEVLEKLDEELDYVVRLNEENLATIIRINLELRRRPIKETTTEIVNQSKSNRKSTFGHPTSWKKA